MPEEAAHLSQRAPVLVYLYGPPAAGKLTIAEQLEVLTEFRVFHNHLTVNAIRPIFEFGSAPFTAVVHRLRLDVFHAAMEAGIDLIFTNNSAWGGVDGRARFEAFADATKLAVETAGGRTLFVRVTAPVSALEARLANESRRALHKLLDANRLRELLGELDDSPLHVDDLTIDSDTNTPEQAARIIATAVGRIT